MRNIYKLVSIIILALVIFSNSLFANTLDSWKNPVAYKPNPILFLHGFAQGRPWDWDIAKANLKKYFDKYNLATGSYLETIDFADSNGSIDTYENGKLGWSDKVQDLVNQVLSPSKYGSYTKKINLVCHSMGGLAARWYIVNYSKDFVEKVILVGVPNKGSQWARIANSISNIPKIGWSDLLSSEFFASIIKIDLGIAINTLKEIDIYGEAVKDLDPEFNGGYNFLKKLNEQSQPRNINYFGIIGFIDSFMNWIITHDYYGGDCVVSIDSQKGTNEVFFKDIKHITSSHWKEIKEASNESENIILNFLDSDKPEFTLDYPTAGSTTQISSTSISIKGKVYKEYLPADSTLIITGVKQENNTPLPISESLLKPSSLWQPNNPDSPVAEFHQSIVFSGEGTYKITTYIKNPAGLESDKKEFFVKVLFQTGTANLIIHCHNPEGKEINYLMNLHSPPNDGAHVYDQDNHFLMDGAISIEMHNQPIQVPISTKIVKATFNGMTIEQPVSLKPNETKELIFEFNRTEFDISKTIDNLNIDNTLSLEESFRLDYYHPVWYKPIQEKYPNGKAFYNSWIFINHSLRIDLLPGEDAWATGYCKYVCTIRLNSKEYYYYLFAQAKRIDSHNGYLTLNGHAVINMGDERFIPVNIPAQNFQNWIIQCNAYKYPAISAHIQNSNTYTNILYFVTEAPFHMLTTLQAEQPIDSLYFGIPPIDLSSKYMAGNSPIYSTPEGASYTESGKLDYLKMSSVPYDLAGEGF